MDQVYAPVQFEAENESAPSTWEICGGNLPPGMTLNENGELSGTPTEAGTYRFVVAVTDGTGDSIGRIYFMTIEPAISPVIVTDSLLAGEVDQDYVVELEAGGTVAPYEWYLESGKLPPGLDLLTYGQIAGTPTAPGGHTFTLRVLDGQNPPGSATQELSIEIVGQFAEPYDNAVRGSNWLWYE